jgi:hypothetical protein
MIHDTLNTALETINRDTSRTLNLLRVYPNHSQLKRDLKRMKRAAMHIRYALELLPAPTIRAATHKETLAKFGASLSDKGEIISPKGTMTAVQIKAGQFITRFVSKGETLATINDSPVNLAQLIRNTWNWKVTT